MSATGALSADECARTPWCLDAHGELSYIPNLAGNALFLSIFAFAMPVQIGLAIRHQTWGYLVAMLGGLLLETVGYAGRIQLHNDIFNRNNFIAYLVGLTIGPAFFSAAIYLSLSRIITLFGHGLCWLRPRTITILFVCFDLLSLILQAVGGALASTANSNSAAQVGVDIMIAGLSSQVASTTAFCLLCLQLAWSIRQHPERVDSTHQAFRRSLRFRAYSCAIGIATLAILIRCTFRVAELSEGFRGSVANDQPLFMVLDGAMMVICVVVLTLAHPGLMLAHLSVRATTLPASLIRFPPSPEPATLLPPLDHPTLSHPFTIPPGLYRAALDPRVPITIATLYAVSVIYANSINSKRKKPWAISQSPLFKVLVIAHNAFLAVYSAWTLVGMIRCLRESIVSWNSPSGFAGTIDSFCKLNGPRGIGNAALYNQASHAWSITNQTFHLAADGLTPDSRDVGRLWNEGLAFYGWIFYISKFYEVIDTFIILAKGKKSSLLQTYHHAGAMICMWAGVRYMSPPIWMWATVNSGIHAIMYSFYLCTVVGIKINKRIKQSLTTMQITQFVVGVAFALTHLFISYQIPVTVPYTAKIGTVVSSAALSATSALGLDTESAQSVAAAAASSATAAWLKKAALRAAGREGLAENVLAQAGPEVAEALQQVVVSEETRYRTELQWAHCLDTSGESFAILLNCAYLAPLTVLFVRFFIKAYLRQMSRRRSSVSDVTVRSFRAASKGLSRQVEQSYGANGHVAQEKSPKFGNAEVEVAVEEDETQRVPTIPSPNAGGTSVGGVTDHEVEQKKIRRKTGSAAPRRCVEAAKRIGQLGGVAAAVRQWDEAHASLRELQHLLADPVASADGELQTLARSEMGTIRASQLPTLARQLATALIPPHPFAAYACLVELHPGAGGSEASLFAHELLAMYMGYCGARGLPHALQAYEADGDAVGGASGLTHAILAVNGAAAYDRFRSEAGVHRVQRVPATEKKGRTHTSAVSVMVLPQLPDTAGAGAASDYTDPDSDYYIAPSDVRSETMRARGAGGQHVNKTDSAVRLTHIPTGIVVAMQEDRAMGGVARTGREDKVRTYNFSQNRVTDHRSGWEGSDIEDILAGGDALDALMTSVREWMDENEVKGLIADEEVEERKKKKT
ncbi:hypothetical protein DV735_g5866, partial [Chaetothyriales sp. CBS 134920]